MAIELRHLRYFVVVAEELHFHRAAERLHVAQPALSHTIKRLEQELDVVLLQRTTRRVELTKIGELFLEKARDVLAAFDELTTIGRELGQGERGHVVVGGSAQVRQRLSHLLNDFHHEHPNVEVTKREDGTAILLDALLDGSVDLAVGLVPERRDGVSYALLGEDRLVLAVPDQHRFAGRGSVAMADLADEAILVSSHPNIRGFRRVVTERCQAAGFEPHFVDRPTQHEEAFQSVLEGSGLELRCWDFVSLRRSPGVTFVAIVPDETVAIELFFRSDEANPAARRFVELATGQAFDALVAVSA